MHCSGLIKLAILMQSCECATVSVLADARPYCSLKGLQDQPFSHLTDEELGICLLAINAAAVYSV